MVSMRERLALRGERQPRWRKFWTEAPAHRNALRLFSGEWASNLAEIAPGEPSSGTPMFRLDERPRQAARAFGRDGRLEGMRILELGPLEGAHSYQLEGLGAAAITAVEANADAFLRCLVIKNMLALDRTTFLLGDCAEFLAAEEGRYDLIFASGVLYHMENPLRLIELMARRADRVFLWTMVFDPAYRGLDGRGLPHRRVPLSHAGLEVDGFELVNRERLRHNFWGGNRLTARWLTLDAIVAAFARFGLSEAEIIGTADAGGHGPSATIAFRRPVAS